MAAGVPLHIADIHGDSRTTDLQFYHPASCSLLVYAIGGQDETRGRLYLFHEGCEEYQGYLFSKPVNEKSVLSLLKQSMSKRQE